MFNTFLKSYKDSYTDTIKMWSGQHRINYDCNKSVKEIFEGLKKEEEKDNLNISFESITGTKSKRTSSPIKKSLKRTLETEKETLPNKVQKKSNTILIIKPSTPAKVMTTSNPWASLDQRMKSWKPQLDDQEQNAQDNVQNFEFLEKQPFQIPLSLVQDKNAIDTWTALSKFSDQELDKEASLSENDLELCQQVPIQALENSAEKEAHLNHFDESDSFFTDGLELGSGALSPNYELAIEKVVNENAFIHQEEDSYKGQFELYHENAPAYVLANAAHSKFKLGKFHKADNLFTKVLELYGENIPAAVLEIAAAAKFKLDKFLESDELYTKSLRLYGENIPAAVLASAAAAKFKLDKFLEADELYTKSLRLYGENVPAPVLADAAYAKFKLGKFPEADDLFTKSLRLYGENAPAQVLAYAACAKFNLSKFSEADELNTKSLRLYGENAPAPILANAACVKFNLSKFSEADELYTTLLRLYGENVPAPVLADAAYAKFKLGKFPEADELLYKIIKIIW